MTTYTRNTLSGSLAPVNNELEKIEVSLREKLDRNPSVAQNNEMLDDLDMNSNRIINYPDAVNDSDLITKGQVASLSPVQSVNGATGNVVVATNIQIDTNAIFDNIAEMKTADLEVGNYVKCKRYYALGELVPDLNFVVSDPQVTDGFLNHTASNEKSLILINNGISVTLAQAGYVSGSKKLFINAVKEAGLKVEDGLGLTTVAPVKAVEQTPNLIYRVDANTVYAINPSLSDAGYALTVLKDNITTTNDSLAVTASDTTMYRATAVLHSVYASVGFNTPTSQTGTWNPVNLNQVSPMPAFNTSERYVYLQNNSNSNESLTYESTPVVDGLVRMSFLRSASSNPAATITIDGTAYVVDLSGATAIIELVFPAFGKDTVDIEIENTSAGAFYFISFLGLYYTELKDWDNTPVDTFGYYRNTALFAEYLDSNSENDYVIKEYNSDTYGGGYHGGETSIVNSFLLDNVDTTITSTPLVTKNLKLKTTCTIDWNPAGQATTIDVTKLYEFTRSGYYLSVISDGDFEAVELYSTLFGVEEGFSDIIFPEVYDLTTDIADGVRLRVGKSNKITYQNPTTLQKFEADITVSNLDDTNQYEGIFIWRVDGVYKKLYYTPVHDGYQQFENGYSAINKFSFL